MLSTIGGWLVDAWQCICSILETLCFGSSLLEHFMHPLEVAFGSNIAYAILIRTGQLQGNRLSTYCANLHSEAKVNYDLLTAENQQVMDGIEIDSNKSRCDNHITETQNRISFLTKRFVAVAISSAILCVSLMMADGIWPEIRLPNLMVVFGFCLLISPVPIGLLWTHAIVREGEKAASTEYENFFKSLEILKHKPKKETEAAIAAFRKKLKAKRPSLLSQLFMSGD